MEHDTDTDNGAENDKGTPTTALSASPTEPGGSW